MVRNNAAGQEKVTELTHRHSSLDVTVAAEAIIEKLRGPKARITAERRAIVWALFAGEHHHVTAEDILKIATRTEPDVHLSTVYRTLETLEGAGVIERLHLDARTVFHLTDQQHRHFHMVCVECGAIVQADVDLFDSALQKVKMASGFEITGYVTASGTCGDCAARASSR